MADDVSRFLDRLRQNRTALRGQILGLSSHTPVVSGRDAGTFSAGVRVFDTVSGEEGEVIGGTRENIVVPVAR